eukprot:gene43370-58744_t
MRTAMEPGRQRACLSVSRHNGSCMSTQRRSYETGHKPKCLVVVDDSEEWDRAVYYASRWAVRVGGGVVMLRVIETEDLNQQWLGVADIMKAFMAALRAVNVDTARGPVKFDDKGNVVGNVYLRKVTRKD